MRLKFLRFKRDWNASEIFWIGINESTTLLNSMKVDDIIMHTINICNLFVNCSCFFCLFHASKQCNDGGVYIYTLTHKHTNTYINVCIYVYIYLYIYYLFFIYLTEFIYIYMCVSIYFFTYTYIYVCIYMILFRHYTG